jgi:hypothetical protein
MSFTEHKLGNIHGLADAAKSVLEGKINVYEIAAELTDEDASDFITAASAAKEEGKSHFMFNGKSYPVTVGDEVAKQVTDALDPVGKEDDDVDNDGDVDDSDEYLQKKRDAIDKAIDDEDEDKEESTEIEEGQEDGVYKSNDEIAPDTKTGVEGQDDVEVKDGEEEEAEEPKEFKAPIKAEGVEGLVNGLSGISESEEEVEEEIEEGKMKDLHQMVLGGERDPKKLAKELGLKPSKDTFDALSALIKGMK